MIYSLFIIMWNGVGRERVEKRGYNTRTTVNIYDSLIFKN